MIFDKYTGDLVGFVDLGDTDLNFSTFQDTEKLASRVMVFYIRALAGDLKFAFSYFGTEIPSNHVIILGCGIYTGTYLSTTSNLCGGASPNRKFYKMHGFMDDAVSEVVYRTVNLFAEDYRFIDFFADLLI